MVCVTDYQHCAETQGCSLEGFKTASALPSYISYTVEISHRLGLLSCIYTTRFP